MKVVVSVGGRFHAFDLARELESHGALQRLITSYPKFVARRFGVSAEAVTSILPVELYKRTLNRLAPEKRANFEPSVNAMFDRLASLLCPKDLDVFVGWSGMSLRTLRRAQGYGALGVIERGSAHIMAQSDLLREEYELQGMRPILPHHLVVRRELAEYEEADVIAVPSSFAYQSFVERGTPASKLLLNPYGVDTEHFSPAEQPPDAFRVLFCGRASLQKGTHYLLQAFRELDLPGSELVLVGSCDPEFEPFRKRYAAPNVLWLGHRPQSELPRFYRRASVFCLPSIQEGMAMVLIQALASGLPLLITPNTGGASLVSEGENGHVVPIRSVERLKEQLLSLYTAGSEACFEMGRVSTRMVAEGYSWRDYGQRARRAYLERLNRIEDEAPVIVSRRPGMEQAPLPVRLKPAKPAPESSDAAPSPPDDDLEQAG